MRAWTPYVLAARDPRSFADGGSALLDPDRSLLRTSSPGGHFFEIEGGHCPHRDNPAGRLAAIDIIASTSDGSVTS